MKLTNDSNLHPIILEAIKAHVHKGEAYSASIIPNPPRQVALLSRHKDEVVEDATERFWSLVGTAWHKVMEMGADPKRYITERYMTQEVLGVKLSGMCDLYDMEEKFIEDWKSTSAWTIFWGSRIKEWTETGNVYAWLTRREKDNNEVKGIRYVPLLRDHDKKMVTPKGRYPEQPSLIIPLELWSDEKADAFIKERIRLFEEAKKIISDSDLPLCTKEERWWNDKSQTFNRCAKYCPVAKWCNQFNGGK